MKRSVSKKQKVTNEVETDALSDQVLFSQASLKKTKEKISDSQAPWYMGVMSKYTVIVRSMAWVLRFISNCRRKRVNRTVGEFCASEITSAESTLFCLIQQETFDGEKDSRIKGLRAYTDQTGLIRLETLITNRDDTFTFRNPVVLDSQHSLVTKLIQHTHEELTHAEVQIVMNSLRERVWILTSWRAIRSVIHKCKTCKRHIASRLKAPPIPLPEPRTRDAAIGIYSI